MRIANIRFMQKIIRKLLFGQKRFFIAVSLFGIFFIMINENPISGMSYVTTFLLLVFTIPIEIKFGAEKGRIAMILVIGVIFGIGGALLIKGSAYFGIHFTEMIVSMMLLDGKILAGIAFVVWSVLILVSYLICINILKKKEF